MAGEFRQANEEYLLGADVSARTTDTELQVLITDGMKTTLAAIVFNLCEQAERIDPRTAAMIDQEGYSRTNPWHVKEPIMEGKGMHLRPYRRRFVVTDDLFTVRAEWEHLFGRPIAVDDSRGGISMSLANESSDALFGHRVATEEEKTEIRGYTRRLFAEVMGDVDLAKSASEFARL